jgi:hypothetical protein
VASETLTGLTEIATQAEANAGTNDFVYITPLKLFGVLSSGAIDANDILLSPTINGNTNVQSALNDALYNIVSPNTSITVTETSVGQVSLVVTQATETQIGGAEVATQIETNTGTDDLRIVTPLKLSQFIASGQITAPEIPLSPAINGKTNVQQALEDAIYNIVSGNTSISVVETATGQTDIRVVQATETQLGGAEVATQAETEAGTDDARIVTPLKLRTAAVYKSDFNAKGDILSASANDTPLILSVGPPGQVLIADPTQPTGLKWINPGIYTLDDVSGTFNGVSVTFPLTIGGVSYTPNPASNLVVFLGGIAQIPGPTSSYTVSGPLITFISPPATGTTFYAFTVRY